MAHYETATTDKKLPMKPPTISPAVTPDIARRAPLGQRFYSIVQQPDDTERFIANRAVELAAAELRIVEPKVFFITETIKQFADLTEAEDIDGSAAWGGKEVYIRTRLEPRHLARICFHEVRHAQQWQRKTRGNRNSDERDARIWAEEMLHRIGFPADNQVFIALLKFKGTGR